MKTTIRTTLLALIALMSIMGTAMAQRTNPGTSTSPIIVNPNVKIDVKNLASDLAITQFDIGTPTVKQGKIRITNNGPGKSPATTLLLEFIKCDCPPGLSKSSGYSIPALASGGSFLINLNSLCNISTDAYLRATVDPDKKVNDPNRINNQKIHDTVLK